MLIHEPVDAGQYGEDDLDRLISDTRGIIAEGLERYSREPAGRKGPG
jgi:hypothetical protein